MDLWLCKMALAAVCTADLSRQDRKRLRHGEEGDAQEG